MIKAWFGIPKTPFAYEPESPLLPHQKEIFDILSVHSRQGGLCLLVGDPGVGKSTIKKNFQQLQDKRMCVITIGRTLHTYMSTIKILCQAFGVEVDGSDFKCERRLVEEAHKLHSQGKSLVLIIDDAHLLDLCVLRKLRLMFDDFPPNHNLILIGQTSLLAHLALRVNEDIKSRITYSKFLDIITASDMELFITGEFDKVGLPHNVLTSDALALIIRSSDGYLRKAKNICLSCLLEAVREQKKQIGIDIVNRVITQPHWRLSDENPSHLRGVS